jgi:hypothetical protein
MTRGSPSLRFVPTSVGSHVLGRDDLDGCFLASLVAGLASGADVLPQPQSLPKPIDSIPLAVSHARLRFLMARCCRVTKAPPTNRKHRSSY